MSKTFLERAKKVKTKKQNSTITEEYKELALAWAKDEVTFTQVGTSLGLQNNPTSVYLMLARSLKKYIQTICDSKKTS